MAYIGIVLFLISDVFQGLLFWRGWRCRGWRAYPFFYVYLSYTTFWSLAFLFFPHGHPLYREVYWDSEFGAAALRFLVAWEVFRNLFRQGTAMRKVAGTAIVGVLFLLTLAFWLSGPGAGISPKIDFMRRMALAASVWVAVVLGMARLYGIRVGRNIWGMAIGLLIFVSSEIANFAAFDLTAWFYPIWRFIHPFAYVFMLAVWTWALWDYAPNPRDQIDTSLVSGLLSTWRRHSVALEETVHKVSQP